MKPLATQWYFLKRPFVVLVALWLVWNASRFDDTKFVAIMAGLFGIFIADMLEQHGALKEVVVKSLDTVEKIKGKNSGNH